MSPFLVDALIAILILFIVSIYESKSLHFDTVAPWTTTKHLEDIGFNDVYRLQYPDPLSNPGFTWPTSRNNYFKAINDRIDYIFMRTRLKEGTKNLIATLISETFIVCS